MQRILFYLRELRYLVRERGGRETLRRLADFLVRRKFFLGFAEEWIDYWVLSRFRDPLESVISVTGHIPSSMERLAIYVSFSANGVIEPHVLAQLKVLREAQYSIVVITASPILTAEGQAQLLKQSDLVIHRQNTGHDFGSWITGWRWLQKNAPQILNLPLESFLMFNDSCLGPYQDMGVILEKMIRDRGVVSGITVSNDVSFHIQSYFIHFGAEIWRKGWVHGYFKRLSILSSKWTVVRYFEIGGSVWLLKQGAQLKAWVDPENPRVKEILAPLRGGNPTHGNYGKLLVQEGFCPLYKRSNLGLGIPAP